MRSLAGNELGRNLLSYFQLDSNYMTENLQFPILIGLHFLNGELKKYKWKPNLEQSQEEPESGRIETGVENFVSDFLSSK